MTNKIISKKRVNIVSVQLVKESSFLYEERVIKSPNSVYNLARPLIANKDREHFLVISLDTKNQPVNVEIAHIGSLNACIAHPRECFKTAILSNAASIVLVHNHPSSFTTGASNTLEPSNEDILVTDRFKKVGEVLGINVIDHLIIGENGFVSLKEKGYL